ncbi:MAG: hypothetical protein A2711_11965 [Burkholderiales bacterium RIFCSPHIGHO2_01_FULL_63_240]|jgi:uncharacterized protein YjbI with pentapeptide repeats|nr:MAG: hypothetical protein A2711_11965 [Burkholderiales bacterium RIFCSPHIGHO2_01_FULL_63_240]
MHTYYESEEFQKRGSLPSGWEESSFKYCEFKLLEIEGGGFGGVLVGCVFENSEFYWSLFNSGIFVDVEFKNCVFRGVSFAGCVFTECRFIGCTFTNDNMGGTCSFPDSRWYACTQTACTGLTNTHAKHV